MSARLPHDDVFTTTEEVPRYLQVNLRTVFRLIKAGKVDDEPGIRELLSRTLARRAIGA